MKKFVIVSVVAAVFIMGSVSMVGGQEPAIVPPEKVNATPGMLTNMIDDVNVPWEILEYVQMKYEGHAVTKAEKINHFGKEVYKLRVDRDSEATDFVSIALLFDMQWKLVGEEKYVAPPPKLQPKVEAPDETSPAETTAEQGGQEQKPDPKEEKPTAEPVAEDPAPTPTPETPAEV